MKRRPGEGQGLTAIEGALALIGTILVVQMWLLTATLESFLAGHRRAALPGAIVSAVLFAAAFALYRFIVRIDRGTKRDVED